MAAIAQGPNGKKLEGTYQNTSGFTYQDEILESILKICECTPNGVLCFVPNYGMLENFKRRLKDNKLIGAKLESYKKIFWEPKQGTNAEFDQLIKEYEQAAKPNFKRTNQRSSGALFFAVFRGKVSEGLDFKDENARAVIAVSIPYPAAKDNQIILKKAYNSHFEKSRHIHPGHAWYEAQAFKALNQALGRCIRHRHDWGAIILLDHRFHASRVTSGISGWISGGLKKYDTFEKANQGLIEFIKKHTKTNNNLKSN